MEIISLIILALACIAPLMGFITHMYAIFEKYCKNDNKNLIDASLLFYAIGFICNTIILVTNIIQFDFLSK